LQAAEKVFGNIILSEAKNLAIKRINYLRDPSSPSAPQDDTLWAFFSKLLDNPQWKWFSGTHPPHRH